MIKLKDEGIGQWPHFSVILVLVLDKSSKCYKEETETDEIRSFKKRLEEEIPEFECVAIIRGVLVLHYSSSFPMSTKEMKKKFAKVAREVFGFKGQKAVLKCEVCVDMIR